MSLTGENQRTHRRTCPNVTSSPHIPHGPNQKKNPVLRCKLLTADHLTYDTKMFNPFDLKILHLPFKYVYSRLTAASDFQVNKWFFTFVTKCKALSST